MSAPERAGGATARRRGERTLTLALWLALLVTMLPLLRVVDSGGWMPGAAALSGALLVTGLLLRRRGAPAVAVTLAELVVWTIGITVVFLHGDAVFGVIPTPDAVAAVPALVQQASAEIIAGVAPIEPTPAMSFVIVASLGLLTIALDHVVLTARMPLLAAVALVIVWLIPAIAVPAEVDVFAFVALAASLLFLIRAETRTREGGSAGVRSAGVAGVALTIGAVAIVGSLIGGAALPPPVVAAGVGGAASIDPTLDLGDDLRRPTDVAVLTMHSDAPVPPNLRVATLSTFDGSVWQPDRMRSTGLDERGLPDLETAADVRVTEYTTSVAVTQLASAYLPVSFPAVEVSGMSGQWRTMPYNRTVLSATDSAQGQQYQVVSHVPRPTLEQIRASSAVYADTRTDLEALPADTPAVIGETARTVTAAATTDYDKLIALQTWFRGSDFTYSLEAPVAQDFDDSSVAAAAAFLDVKKGYCVHFAGAFALMSRSLGMPTRVVVGFLPGAFTGDEVGDERVVEVTTAQLHAWPEVYFDGIGWVPFEPTKGLGTATRFVSAAAQVDDGGEDVTAPTATPTPTTSASALPAERPDEAGGATGTAVSSVDLRPFLGTVGVLLLIAIIPAAIAWVRRIVLSARRRIGSAWRMVQDAAIDLDIAVPLSDSPRAFGARLVALHGAPAEPVDRLVRAMERASYAPAERAATEPDTAGAVAAGDAAEIRRAMLAAAGVADRIRAIALPRSLVVRPGSTFAERDALA